LTQPGPRASEKRELRAALRSRRTALAASERMRAAEAIAQHLLTDPLLPASGYIAGYWAMAGELPLHVLQMRLGPGQLWCLPCIQDDNSLRFAPWRPGDPLVSNRFGFPEPDLAASSQLGADEMAMILLPLVGFSRAGARLGTGGGYYDRSLAFRLGQSAPPLLVGVGYDFQELPSLPVEPWDVPLDAVLTESGLHPCHAPG
jgi:5-formyltetrahydrofolate cyclo-ligase